MTKVELVFNLSARYPELELSTSDVNGTEDAWTIDGMDPYEWAEAMTMD